MDWRPLVKGSIAIMSIPLIFFFGFDNYFLFNFFGFFAPAYCGPVYSSVNEPTVDNGGGSVTVAVGVSDM